ncbi:Uncharacterised protein [Pseudomonas aeruginosa]|nr:Uncharacterised protein [Pseudomonas aeruginosa]
MGPPKALQPSLRKARNTARAVSGWRLAVGMRTPDGGCCEHSRIACTAGYSIGMSWARLARRYCSGVVPASRRNIEMNAEGLL